MDREGAIQVIAGLRAAVGTGAWLTPDLAAKAFGLAPSKNPQLAYMGRLFGARDVALAAGLVSSSGGARDLWLRIGLACDAADAAAALLAGRNGTLPKVTAALVFAPAVAGIALGAVALRESAGPA